jgi:exonuclease III
LASHGDADIIIIVETHLPSDPTQLDVPGYRMWTLCRSGARKCSGGVAVLVRDRLGADVSVWQPATRDRQSSPVHLWLRLSCGALPEPLFLLAAYLPPFRSRYGLRSSEELFDYFSRLGDEATEIRATGGEVLLAGDWNAHTGSLPDWVDHSDVFQAALQEDDELLLLDDPSPSIELRPRTNACSAAPCPQGKALLHFCADSGLPILNGRVTGDEQGSPTCFSGNPSTIDYFCSSPTLLSRAAHLQVLPPIPEYQVHRPVELLLSLPSPPASTGRTRCR